MTLWSSELPPPPPKDGTIHAFLEKGDLSLGSVIGTKGSALRLLCNDGRERLLPQRRVLGVCGSLDAGRERQAVVEQLEAMRRQILEQAQALDLETLWEALADQDALMEVHELARHWFGEHVTAEQAVATSWAVLQESIRFKLRGQQVRRQPAEVVEQKLREQAEAERRERRLREALAWIGGGARPQEGAEELVAQLKEVALFGTEAPRFDGVRDLLRKLGPGGHEAHTSFDALVSLGVWGKDENLELLREDVPVEPEPAVLEAAERAGRKPLDRSVRTDWTQRETLTIDPAETRDVDDAITCWLEGERLLVAVHITDVTEYIEPEGALDLDARMRGLSIYLPTRVIPMLPAALSEQAASLLPGAERPAITLLFEAGSDGVALAPRFELSTIRVTSKLSYAEVDRRLPEDRLLQRLLAFCQAHRARRLQQGAVLLPLPEILLRVDADDRVQVRLEKDSESHQLVSELMICFNSEVARLCSERGVPALFRGQPEPRRRLLGAQPRLLECLLQRRQMLRSVTALAPARHSGLGLDAYTMCTSPLRRYLDLCLQWQLRGVLLEKPPLLDAQRLEELLPYLSVAERRAQRIERGTSRFWMHRWLEQLGEPLVQALWLDPMSGRDRAALLPFLTEADVDLKGQKPPRKGTLVELGIARVHAREADLKLELRGPARKLDPINEPLAELIGTS